LKTRNVKDLGPHSMQVGETATVVFLVMTCWADRVV